MFFYRELDQALVPTDPYFNNVSLLLRGAGTVKTAGPILDESGNSFSVTINGDVVLSTTKKHGQYSMKFDGNADYLTISNSTGAFTFGTGDFTIETWVRLDSMPLGSTYPNGYWIIGAGPSSGDPGIDIFLGTSNLIVAINAYSNPNINIPHGMTTNTWYHLAIVRSGNTLYAFKDGILLVSANVSGVTADPALTGLAICAAEPVGSTGGNFNGYIDDLRITKGIARYTANFSVPDELPTNSDPHFNNVSLLLRGNGSRFVDSIKDESNNSNAVVIAGDTVLSSTIKKYGNYSIKFDGNGDYLTVQPNSGFNLGSGDFTIETWIYLNSMPPGSGYPSGYWICGWGEQNSATGFDFFLGTSNLILAISDYNNPNINTPHGMTTNTWYHIAIVRNGNTLSAYKDGVLLASSNVTGISAYPAVTGMAVGAGEPVGATGGNPNMYIDDFRITKGVARYTSNFTPPDSELPNS